MTSALIVIEIKAKKRDVAEREINNRRSAVDDAILQLSEYCDKLSKGDHAQLDGTGRIAAFLIYGEFYTRIRYDDNTRIWRPDPFQAVFEELALNDGRAPLLYRLSELAVNFWNLII